MINLRMLGLASALLLLLPIGGLANPASQDVVEVAGELVLEVRDVVIGRPDRGEGPPPDWTWDGLAHDQLVEGHTVFVTIQTVRPVVPVEWNATIDGFVECTHHGEVRGTWFFGLPIPYAIEDVHARCRVGERVVVTPSLYANLTDPPLMTSTGAILPFVTPDGQAGYVEELSFTVDQTPYYAYLTPILDAWESEEGAEHNFRVLIPSARLREMGDTNLVVMRDADVHRE